MNDEEDEIELKEPSEEEAEKFLRKVDWENRLSGTIDAGSGPGKMTKRIYSLEGVHNLLKGMERFKLDFKQLKNWISNTLKDEELSREIEDVLDEELEGNKKRERVVDLLGKRIEQCKIAIEKEEEGERGEQ